MDFAATFAEPFNSDSHIGRKLAQLASHYQIRLAIETGTYTGVTSRCLAKMFERLRTIEIDPERFEVAKGQLADLANVEVLNGDSAGVLKVLLEDLREPVLFYLDAHWQDRWPLLCELEAIAGSRVPCAVIAIHDFKVEGLGYDSYGGQDLDFGYVQNAMCRIFPTGFTWETNDRSCAEGACRGIAYFHGTRKAHISS